MDTTAVRKKEIVLTSRETRIHRSTTFLYFWLRVVFTLVDYSIFLNRPKIRREHSTTKADGRGPLCPEYYATITLFGGTDLIPSGSYIRDTLTSQSNLKNSVDTDGTTDPVTSTSHLLWFSSGVGIFSVLITL